MLKKISTLTVVACISAIFAFAIGFYWGKFSLLLFDPWISKLNAVEKYIADNYYEKVDLKKIREDAIRGMVSGLDPNSAYYTADEFEIARTQIEGEFYGIGVRIQTDMTDGYTIIVAVMPGYPAFKVGVKAGDKIIKIDDVSIKGWTMMEVVKKIRGKEGQPVKLSLLRDGKMIEKTIIREKIKIEPVRYTMIGGNIGYIRILNFTTNLMEFFDKAAQELMNKKVNALVIDLRFDPGGSFNQAVELADRFLDDEIIIRIEGRHEQDTKTYYATKKDTLPDIPVVVIVNSQSASASEIFASALKENNRAEIVGEKTYGKGTMQRLFPLPDDSALRLTIAKFFSPKGNQIDKVGVEPDHKITLTDEEYENLIKTWADTPEPHKPLEIDHQLAKAIEILKNKLK